MVQMVQRLLAEAERLCGSAITIHLGQRLVDMDVAGCTATFEGADADAPVTEKYDILVGADGVNSAVRSALSQQVGARTRAQAAHLVLRRTSWFQDIA